MKLLVFHGYLLRGTGSNIYTASLAQALARAGHEVHVCCQDLDAAELSWVAGVGSWETGRLVLEGAPPAPGSVTAYRPPIGRILPVYVEDRYPGFEAKAFGRLSDEEITAYVKRNVAAVAEIADHAGGLDAAVSNHLVMGAVICARAGLPYAAKMHGSDVAYTIKPEPERFLPYALEGLAAPEAILVGSRHIADELVELTGEQGLMARIRLAPPGVDTELFHPVPAASREPILRGLSARLANGEQGPFGRDPRAAAAAIAELASASGPRVLYVGKLITQKGIELLLEAWPAVHDRIPGARLCIVGFGELEAEVRRAAAASGGSIVFAGRLEHDEVAELAGCVDAQVVPSVFPEAFGMVAAEAAASGAIPVCANHSGLAEVAGAIAGAIGGDLAAHVRFELGPGAAADLADSLGRLLVADAGERARAGGLAREVCIERWSWDRVAAGIAAAARGDLSHLRQVRE